MQVAATLLFLLLFGHALADYPLQGEFLSKAKNPVNPMPGVPWYLALGAHAFIQAGFVLIFTGSILLAMSEFVAHATIDIMKCTGRVSFLTDQLLHVLCKVIWVIFVCYYG